MFKDIEEYNKALQEVTEQLRIKRSELASQAQLTVEDLNKSIPLLRNTIESLKLEISQLSEIIENLRKEQARETFDAVSHYNALEADLKKDYEYKKEKLRDTLDQITAIRDAIDRENEDLKAREVTLANNQGILAIAWAEFNTEKEKFDNYKKNELAEIERKNKELLSNQEILNNNLRIVKEQQESLKAKIVEFETAKAQADDILLKIDEAQKVLDEAKNVSISNALQLEEINKQSVKNRADMVKNSKRTDELNEIERQLKERESNIKLLESKV